MTPHGSSCKADNPSESNAPQSVTVGSPLADESLLLQTKIIIVIVSPECQVSVHLCLRTAVSHIIMHKFGLATRIGTNFTISNLVTQNMRLVALAMEEKKMCPKCNSQIKYPLSCFKILLMMKTRRATAKLFPLKITTRIHASDHPPSKVMCRRPSREW